MRCPSLVRALAVGILCTAVAIASPGRAPAADPPFPLGMNLAGVADYSSELVFVDAFKASRPWTPQKEGADYGQGGVLEGVQKTGWPTKLADKQFAEALMFVDMPGHIPAGKYFVTWEGNGEIEFNEAAHGTLNRPGEIEVKADAPLLALRIRKTDPKKPVKNIKVIKSEYKNTTSPFLSSFLKRYEGFQVIRFMDWQRVNNSKIEKWEERPLKTDPTQASEKGVALEYCLEAAKALKADPWLCIPHRADDNFVQNFAATVLKEMKGHPRPDWKVYVEYSNETWNTIFDQAKYCKDQGMAKRLSTNEYEAQLRFSAERSLQVFKIFEDVFKEQKGHLVRVLAAHAANPWTGVTEMDWKDTAKGADAIAIAPYFGNAYGDPKTLEKVQDMSVDELLDGCRKMVADNKKTNATYAAEAKKRGLKLMTYESGQHLVGYGGAENNEKLTKLFHEANRHPKMKELYLEDLKNWQEIGGSTFCVFSSVGRYTKWGSWGVLEYSDQKEDTAPKMMALREWMKK
jgi:hypothetical protein